jgi:hypothetical protein
VSSSSAKVSERGLLGSSCIFFAGGDFDEGEDTTDAFDFGDRCRLESILGATAGNGAGPAPTGVTGAGAVEAGSSANCTSVSGAKFRSKSS